LWRSDFLRGGVQALKASVAPGAVPVKSKTALHVVTPLLEAPVTDRRNWTIAPGCAPRSRRLQLRKRQAEAGDIVLIYGDESEALTHPYLARAWAKAGADLHVRAPEQARKVAMLGSPIISRAGCNPEQEPQHQSGGGVEGLGVHDRSPFPARPNFPTLIENI